MALSSVMVTCLALSTAVATCCWCSCERNGRIWAIMAFNLFAISVWKQKGERSLLKGKPFQRRLIGEPCLLIELGRITIVLSPLASHTFPPSLSFPRWFENPLVSIIEPVTLPVIVHYLIRVLLSPASFLDWSFTARIVGLRARVIYIAVLASIQRHAYR